MSLAVRVAELRRKHNQSLQDVATAVKVSRAHIWEMERGRAKNPSMDLVARLADHFGVSVSYLVGEDLEASDADAELQRMFRQAGKLDERDRAILDNLLQTLVNTRKAE